MTPSEFKAWFDGFTEALEGRPSDEQWKRIKARVAEIDGRPITQPIYVDRYLPYFPRGPYYPYYYGSGPSYPYYGTWGVATAGSTRTVTGTGSTNVNAAGTSNSFDSHGAMLCLGRAEAQSLNS